MAGCEGSVDTELNRARPKTYLPVILSTVVREETKSSEDGTRERGREVWSGVHSRLSGCFLRPCAIIPVAEKLRGSTVRSRSHSYRLCADYIIDMI